MADCPYCDDLHPRGSPACPGRRLGQVVAGKYQVDAFLGMGGMGAVYAVTHRGLGRPAALKVMHPEVTSDPDLVGRFVREARELAALGHPGIVEVRDSGTTEDGAFYIEMELLQGTDLRALVEERGALPIERAVALAIEALDALAVIHARGVVHRDLKSPNLFLARRPHGEKVVILDFGFAKANDAQQLTQPGELLGSPLYMSPEQCRDSGKVDARADLFSMGVILYEMLTGTWPYSGRKRKQILEQVLLGQLERNPRAHRPEIPEWLDGLVARSLAYEPANRPDSARHMKEELELGGKRPPGGFLKRLFKMS